MLEVNEALQLMLAEVRVNKSCGMPLLAALGCRAARDVMATEALPGFDNSAMDGYAVRSSDAAAGAMLLVVGEAAAGHSNEVQVVQGQAMRIFTGAQLPAGADAVIMQEDVRRVGDLMINDDSSVEPGQFIRRAGSDVCAGQVILRRGEVITASRIGLLASQGRAQVDVVASPRVGVMTTGDELVMPGGALSAGKIYNSNGLMLQALCQEAGVRECSVRHAQDTLSATTAALRELMEISDVVLVAGGVSVGDHDCVKPALSELGITADFWRVRMKPGKPFLFAAHEGRIICGLPGNPVSAFVTFKVLVQPLLKRMMGALEGNEESVRVTMGEALVNSDERPTYIRGRVVEGVFTSAGLQRSDALFGLSQCNALLRLEPGETIELGVQRQIFC